MVGGESDPENIQHVAAVDPTPIDDNLSEASVPAVLLFWFGRFYIRCVDYLRLKPLPSLI